MTTKTRKTMNPNMTQRMFFSQIVTPQNAPFEARDLSQAAEQYRQESEQLFKAKNYETAGLCAGLSEKLFERAELCYQIAGGKAQALQGNTLWINLQNQFELSDQQAVSNIADALEAAETLLPHTGFTTIGIRSDNIMAINLACRAVNNIDSLKNNMYEDLLPPLKRILAAYKRNTPESILFC